MGVRLFFGWYVHCSFLVVSHDSIRGRVRPLVRWSVRRSVGPSVTSFFGGQKRRRRTTYFVYTNLFLAEKILKAYILSKKLI